MILSLHRWSQWREQRPRDDGNQAARWSAVFKWLLTRGESRQRENDHFDLDRIAGRLLDDYRRAVTDGAARRVLAQILTGLAGCELAMSRTHPVAWSEDETPDPDGWTVGESAGWSGLLVQEISYAAGDGTYRGVRAPELGTEEIAGALRNLSLAYRGGAPNPLGDHGAPGDAIPVGGRLGELWHVVVEVIGRQGAEVLVPLMLAHGYDPYGCSCDKHGAGDLPAQEQERRARVTGGTDGAV